MAAVRASPHAGCDLPPAAAVPADATSGLTVLYTAAYHATAAPSTYSESDGAYVGFDGAVRRVWNGTSGPGVPDADGPAGRFVSDLSLWDIHRAQTQWLFLVAPDAWADTTKSLLAMASQSTSGALPRWPFASFDSLIMQGSHGLQVAIDGVLKNGTLAAASGISTPLLWNATVATITAQDATLSYDQVGYVPVEAFQRGASETLEFAADDAVAARLATAVGDSALAQLWTNRSMSYRAVWSPSGLGACPRWSNGTQWCPLESLSHPFNPWYVEGDTLQWTWFVPHDLPGLVGLFPSPDAFAAKLEGVMANQTEWWIGTVLPNPFDWAGNEPSMLLPWLYPFAGSHYLPRTQYWTRWLLSQYYTTRFDGIPGNCDYGTLSSWAVWAYLGLYPVAGTDTYVLGSPVVASATVTAPAAPWLDASPTAPAFVALSVTAHNASADNVYVARVQVSAPQTGGEAIGTTFALAQVNGVTVSSGITSYGQLWGGQVPGSSPGVARLEFWMAAQPVAVAAGHEA